MNTGWLLAGMACFLFAQVLRAIRWQIILPNDALLTKHRLVLFVSLGSLLNALLPLRAGDLLRSVLLSRLERVRFSVSIVSVLVERATDVLVIVALTHASFYAAGHPVRASLWLLLVPLFLVLTWAAVRWSLPARKLVFLLSSAWNSYIQHAFLEFFWAIVLQMNHVRFLSGRYVAATGAMWVLYLASYACFYSSIPGLAVDQVWQLFHGDQASGRLATFLRTGLDISVGALLGLFLLVPILAASVYSVVRSLPGLASTRSRAMMQFLSESAALGGFGVPSAFTGRQAYDSFLVSHFSGQPSTLAQLGARGFGDCRISRIFNGGSGALTAVVEREGRLSIRKVAEGSGAHRLRDQHEWLRTHANGHLPVVVVGDWHDGDGYSYYEMPYDAGAVDMYEWLHTVPADRARHKLLDVMDAVASHHERHRRAELDPGRLRRYLEEKVQDNVALVRHLAGGLIDLDRFRINDEEYSFSEWSFLEDTGRLARAFSHMHQTDIHGDLTIENLVVRSDGTWMAIDPNPTSMFKVGLMDWAKMLQSVHKGYEGLSRSTRCRYDLESLRFLSQRSDLYQQLHGLVLDQLRQRFGPDAVRETELHEIVHYLRLLPYKFRASEELGLLFFGVTCLLIREFRSRHALP